MSPDDFPDDHKLHDLTEQTDRELRFRLGGKQFPLSELPTARIGLPLTGTADLAIALTIPKVDEDVAYPKTAGSITISCTDCQIGDDKSKLQLGTTDVGIPISHLTVDSLRAQATVADGVIELTRWQFASPDLDLELALTVKLASSLFASSIDGCIRFAPTKQLEARDPKLHAFLSLTGGVRGSDGRYHIKLGGTLLDITRTAKECGS